MATETEFDYYVALSIAVNPGDAYSATYPVVPNMKFMNFVKFSGANALAGLYGVS